jgi:cell filamentation protein
MSGGATQVDPYVYAGTEVLKNLRDIRDRGLLERFERRVTAIRIAQLSTEGRPVAATVDHFRSIHRHIFQDVYAWAGELRTVNIARGETRFAPVRTPANTLESWGEVIFKDLRSERLLLGMDREHFVGRLGHYSAEINFWHPFRDGSGRTVRVFAAGLAKHAGYSADYTQVTPEQWNRAAAASVADARAFEAVWGSIITVPRAQAFDRLPVTQALRDYPELRGAYRTYAAVERSTERVRSESERAQVRARHRAEISKVLHQGRIIDPPVAERERARVGPARELSR